MELTRENYHSREQNMSYLSVSQIKDFLSCSARAKATLDGLWEREESDELLVGRYLDVLFGNEEDRVLFERQNRVYKKDGEPYQKYVDAIKVYERAKQDEVFYDLCANGEGQVIMTGTIQGIPFKVMFDNVHEKYLCDRKYMRNVEPIYDSEIGQRVSFAEYYGYLYQAALYQMAYIQNTGEKKDFLLCVMTKEKEPRIEVFKVSDEAIENALGIIRANVQRIDDMKKGKVVVERCGYCSYCVKTHKTSPNEEDWLVI